MKGFLITVGIVLALLITGISQISNICQVIYDEVDLIEGGAAGKEAFDKLKDNSPDQFKQKYEEAIPKRLLIGKLAFYLGADDMFKVVGADTRERYLGTALEKVEGVDLLLYRFAKTLEDRQPDVYYMRLVEIFEHFPNCDFKDELEKKIKLMKVRLNIAQ